MKTYTGKLWTKTELFLPLFENTSVEYQDMELRILSPFLCCSSMYPPNRDVTIPIPPIPIPFGIGGGGIGIGEYWYWSVLVLVGIGIGRYWYWWVLVLVSVLA